MQIRASLALLPLFLAAACTQSPFSPVRMRTPDVTDKVKAHLQEPILQNELTSDNQSIEKVLRYIAAQNNLNIIVNWTALGVANVEKTTPVTLNLHNLSIASAVQASLDQTNPTSPLGFAVVDGIVHISTRVDLAANTSVRYILRNYDVHDLISLPTLTGTNNPNRRMVYLIDLVTLHISPNTCHVIQYPDGPHPAAPFSMMPSTTQMDGPWPRAEIGGATINEAATGEGIISAFNSSLIISQTPEILEEIAQLLQSLRQK